MLMMCAGGCDNVKMFEIHLSVQISAIIGSFLVEKTGVCFLLKVTENMQINSPFLLTTACALEA